ncbi:PREDICTED: uncharacterized protein LOC109591066, partial [Amphimedon queenslandica]|uniref:SAM domain-containing protein n=2 Tax=Amphimedon queenslandica TaxID=400682 RepID=A0AAN0JZT4_AMPQE
MGANQGREGIDAASRGLPGRPGAISPGNKYTVQPPASAQALQALLNPVKTTEHHSLDRTLKGFLRHCNLGGLEYRLRLAGIYSLEDLVHIDEAKLCRHGFTQLMAKRLYDSLDEYLAEPEEITPPVPLRRRPSEMVRRVQMPFTR